MRLAAGGAVHFRSLPFNGCRLLRGVFHAGHRCSDDIRHPRLVTVAKLGQDTGRA